MYVDRVGARAFTLIEVVAALAIIGGAIVGLLALRERAQQNAVLAREVFTSARLCASCVDAFRAGILDLGEGEFEAAPGYGWSIAEEAAPTDAPTGLGAYRVNVSGPSGVESGASVVLWRFEPERLSEASP